MNLQRKCPCCTLSPWGTPLKIDRAIVGNFERNFQMVPEALFSGRNSNFSNVKLVEFIVLQALIARWSLFQVCKL